MRVIYLFRSDGFLSGVEEKVSSQIQLLRKGGVDCCAYYFVEGRQCLQGDYLETVEIPAFNHGISLLNKIRRELYIVKMIGEKIASLDHDDVLYMRIPYPSFPLSRVLSRARACKIVIEYQTVEPLEYRANGKRWYLFIDYLFGNAIRRYSDGIVGVTDEITQYELSRSGHPSKPHMTIGNGYDVESVPVRTPPRLTPKGLELLCVSSVKRWHGLDRLLKGLADYHGPIEVALHIVGEGAELASLKGIATDLHISDRVIFHGYRTGEALERLFDTCHIAVGSLGLHRKGLIQTSELKGREYCARGIPYLIACTDPDIPDDFPFLLRMPPDESPIDIDTVVEFAQAVCGDSAHPDKMRAFASEHLDWSIKMNQLRDFLIMVIEGSPDQQTTPQSVKNRAAD